MSLQLNKWREKNSISKWGIKEARVDQEAEEARAEVQIIKVGVKGDLNQDQAQEPRVAEADLGITICNDL